MTTRFLFAKRLLKPAAVWLVRLNQHQPALSFAGGLSLASVPGLLLLAAFDPRTVLQEDPWLKPLKFAFAFAVYFWTLAWMLTHVPASSRAKHST